jgi:tetratricopeptide (TPR) repeat protein
MLGSYFAMRANRTRIFFVLIFILFSTKSWAQQTPPIQPAKASPGKTPAKVSAGTQLLYGSFPLTTKSLSARQNLEMALDQYENAGFEEAVMHAQLATDKDPKFALGYALWSFAARRSEPAPEALKKATELATKCIGDECLMITFLVGTQEANVLPAISAMNDLLAHRPKDKHVLYLAGEWLYFQQDYDHAKKLWAKSLEIDPDFPPSLNMLGYLYVEAGDPDPQKAIQCLKHYAAVLPDRANPQDSLGEVLRMSGEDGGSLAHYAEALRINPQMLTSQYGRGDTYAMMGNANQAKIEYEKALQMSNNARDTMHIQFQLAMLHFWNGDISGGREELAKLSEKVAKENDAAAQFEINYARALLSPDVATERELLKSLETSLSEVRPGMQEADRNVALANVLREEVRVAVAAHQSEEASNAVQKLQQLCDASRDRLVESVHESAIGYRLLASGDYVKSTEQFKADLHAPLVVQSFIISQEKLGNAKAVDSARRRLQYLRTPTAEWFAATHETGLSAQVGSQ